MPRYIEQHECSAKKCTEKAEYHITKNGKHKYFCVKHWCKSQKLPYGKGIKNESI